MKLFPLLMMVLIMSGKVYSLPAIFFIDSVKKTIDADSEIFIAADVEPDGNDIRRQISAFTVYPEEALRSNLEGQVMLKILVDFSGEITKVLVDKYTDKVFINSAMEAAYKVKTNPAMQEGKPIQYWMLIPVRFSLRSDYDIQVPNKPVCPDTLFTNPFGREIARLVNKRLTVKEYMVKGNIHISATLTKDGYVRDVRILNSTESEFEDIVINILEKCRIIYAINEERPDFHDVNIVIPFKANSIE